MEAARSHNLWVLGQRVSVVPVTEGCALIDIIAPPSVPGPPLHLHQDCSELFYVLEGELDVIVEQSRLRLGVGQSTVVPPHTLHTFHNPTNADVRIITVYNPAGFEKFFLAMGVPDRTPNAQAASVDAQIIGRLGAEAGYYGMHVPTV